MGLNNDELTPWTKKIRQSMLSKQNGKLELTVRPGYLLCSHIEKVEDLMFKKYLKVFLSSKSQYLKQQDSS